MTQIIQIRKRGTLTLPKDFRKRYQLEEGDPLTLIDLGEGFFLSPKQSVLPKLVAQIEDLAEENGVSLTELIESVQKIRHEEK